MRALCLLPLCLCLLACHRDPPPSAGDASPADAAVSAEAAAPEAGVVDAGEAKVPLTAEEKKAISAYSAAMGEGRAATRAKRFADAEEAFGKALAARPEDARARSERGYARLLDGALEKAEEDFQGALGRGVDGKLAGQVFFNIGLLREKKNEMEGARAAFAISNALSPTAAAKVKLAGRSTCTVDVQTGGSDVLEHASGWEELDRKIAPGKDLGSPKASVCVRSHTAMADPDEKDVCQGPPPWTLNHHHLHFTEDLYFVVPQKASKKPDGFFFYSTRIGSWPAHCTNLPFATAEMTGDFLHVKETFDGKMAALDESNQGASSLGPSVVWDMACLDVLGYESHAFYDTVTGRRLVRLYLPANVPQPKISVAGAKITLAGAGCDRVLDLVALRR